MAHAARHEETIEVMALSRIVMRLARNPGTEFADGDDHRGYTLTAPLTADGMFDEVSRDFGSVPRGQILTHPFRLVNNTGQPVQMATMDAGYAVTRLFAALETRGIEAVVPTRPERPPRPGVIPVRRFKLDAHHNHVRA